MKLRNLKALSFGILIVGGLLTSSCTTYQQQGATAGGLAGAAAGAIFGDNSSDVVRGAAIGAAGGAGLAALNEDVNRRAGNYNNGGDYYPSQQTQGYQSYPQNSGAYGTPSYQATPPVVQTAPTLPAASSYPVAKRTSDPDVVTSPFDPTRKIGVKGYKSGDLVRDPKNKQIFRVP